MVLVLLMVSAMLRSVACNSNNGGGGDGGDGGDGDFQLLTGYAYSAPQHILRTLHGVARLTQCIAQCREQPSCRAVNYETGVCVLFAAPGSEQTARRLVKSQFPVFTMLAQRLVPPLVSPLGECGGGVARPWVFEVVPDHVLAAPQEEKNLQFVADQQACMELCLAESRFPCRSASYVDATGACSLSPMDRFSLSGQASAAALLSRPGVNHLESNCATHSPRMCDFTQIRGYLLKTVDSVYQDVDNLEACREMCLRESDFRCRTFDYDAAGPRVCRLSHHTMASLEHIEEPYLELDRSVSYQLSACYNITVECRSTAMIAHVQTNTLFNGKVYAKNRPNACVTDVVNSLEFDIQLGYEDGDCEVRQESPGRFAADIILQHHDQIVTSQDVGLSVKCSYSLDNRSVGLGVQLELDPPSPAVEQGAVVAPPAVSMRITDPNGDDIQSAQVGDSLRLRFHVVSVDTPYQIFVRELIAMDGVDSSEILLIDSMGCPTDPTIMGAITVVQRRHDTTILEAPFDAFKFPSSQVVQFKALVTPCAPSCEPVSCHVLVDQAGTVRRVESYGRRRRRKKRRSLAASTMEPERVVMQQIRIADKSTPSPSPSPSHERHGEASPRAVVLGAVASGVLLCGQMLLASVWLVVWASRRQCRQREDTVLLRDGSAN